MTISVTLTVNESILARRQLNEISTTITSKPTASAASLKLNPTSNTIQISSAQPTDTYTSYQRIQSAAFSNIKQDDAYSLAVANRLNGNSDTGIQNGLKLLPDLLESGESSYKQDIRQYSSFRPSNNNGKTEEIDLVGFQDREKKNLANLTLQLKTKDGDVINFSLNTYQGDGKGEDGYVSGFNGIVVSFEFEGELSAAEREQIDTFIQKLAQQAEQFFRGNDVDIKQLDLSSFSKFEDIELSLSGGRAKHDFSFNYHDDIYTRSIKISLNGDRSELVVDKSSLNNEILTKQSQQSYEELLLKSTKEVHADRNITELMKDVFALGFKNLAHSNVQSGRQQSPNQTNGDNSLVGLPDFTFSLNSKNERPNQQYRPSEYQGFSIDLSLKTKVEKNSVTGKEVLTQTQSFSLKGAYYSPVGLLQSPDFDSQTYKYTKLDRTSEHVTQLISQNNKLISAISTESGENKTKTIEYEMGKKVDEKTDRSQYDVVQDFTEQARQQSLNKNLQLLDLVMIDPYQIPQN